MEMGPEEVQHQRGQLLLVPGVTVVGLCDDAQLVVGDVRRELQCILRRHDLVFGAVDRENPTHHRMIFLLLIPSTDGVCTYSRVHACVRDVSPADFAYGTAGEKGISAQPVFQTRFPHPVLQLPCKTTKTMR